jgi:hypothetical protein
MYKVQKSIEDLTDPEQPEIQVERTILTCGIPAVEIEVMRLSSYVFDAALYIGGTKVSARCTSKGEMAYQIQYLKDNIDSVYEAYCKEIGES